MDKMSPKDQIKIVLDLLQSVSYFEELDANSLEEFARNAVRKEYKPGAIVMLEGDPPGGMYLVESGSLKATKVSRSGREQILDIFGPEHIFNAISVFTDAPAIATVTALEAATVWQLPAQAIIHLVETNPKAAKVIIQKLARRVQFLVAKVEDLALRSIEARYAKYLISESVEGMVERKRWTTQAEMAAQIGTVPDVLHRVLRKFEERGLIKVSRHRIELVEIRTLREIALLE